jgi:hypothetical protein
MNRRIGLGQGDRFLKKCSFPTIGLDEVEVNVGRQSEDQAGKTPT